MSQISTVINSNIIPFVVDVMPCKITIFPRIFQIRFTVRISSYSTNSMSVSVTRCDSPTESEKFLLEISFMYPENYNDRACVGRRIFIYYRYYDQPISGLDILKIQIYFGGTNFIIYSVVSHSRLWPTVTTPPRVRETSGNVMQSTEGGVGG